MTDKEKIDELERRIQTLERKLELHLANTQKRPVNQDALRQAGIMTEEERKENARLQGAGFGGPITWR